MILTQDKASNVDAGFIVAGWQAETTQENTQAQSNTDAAALNSRSTSTEAQRKKLIALLRLGSKTTIELRDAGLMMPAVRVFEIRADGYVVNTEMVTLTDANGFRHPKCARYALLSEPPAQFDLPGVSDE